MSAPAAPAEDVVGLADLYTETVEACVIALFVLAGVVLALGAIGRNAVDGATAALVPALALIALIARHFARAGAERIAVAAIVAGLCGVYEVALVLLPSDAVAPWMSLVVLMASVLLGWRWGMAVGTGLALSLAMVVARGWPLLEVRDALSASLLSAAAIFLAWMTTRPTRTALDCASRCYHEAQTAVHALQGRQAELARFGKSLSGAARPAAARCGRLRRSGGSARGCPSARRTGHRGKRAWIAQRGDVGERVRRGL